MPEGRLAAIAFVALSLSSACVRSHGDVAPVPSEPTATFDALARVDSICDDGEYTPVELDDSSDMGFSADDLLAFSLGEHAAPLAFVDPDLPERPTTQLTVAVEPRDGDAVYFDAEHGAIGHGLHCFPWLQVPVEVTLRSDDGALRERFETTLYALSPIIAGAYLQPTPDQLRGTLVGQLEEAEVDDVTGLDIELLFSPHGLSGRVYVRGGDRGGGRPFGGQRPWARLRETECGLDGDFEVPLDAAVHGTSAEAAIDRVLQPTATVRWRDGSRSELELSLQPDSERACLTHAPYLLGEMEVELFATVQAQSADGRLSGSFPGVLRYADFRAPDSVSFRTPGRFEREPATALGFPEVTVPEDALLSASLRLHVDEDGKSHGQAELYEDPEYDCTPAQLESDEVTCSGNVLVASGEINPDDN